VNFEGRHVMMVSASGVRFAWMPNKVIEMQEHIDTRNLVSFQAVRFRRMQKGDEPFVIYEEVLPPAK
jgi:hypothetical protein